MRTTRGWTSLALAITMALAVSLCIVWGTPRADAGQMGAGGIGARVPEDVWRERTDDYLTFVTDRGLNESSVMSILAHAERHERDGFVWDSNAPDPSDFEARFQQLREFRDTGDFAINDYLFMLLRHGDQLRPDLVTAFEERIHSFKYWWTEPTPDGVTDSQYYWTENHLIIFLANEFIAGQTYPDTVFTNSGMTGRQHMEHARPLLLRWMSLRARFGWSEWLSNVYWIEDLKGLLLLADWSEDEEITRWSSALLDIMFVELASHLQNGSFGATHGRSYLKDKMTARTEDTYALAKMVFDDSPGGYENVDNASLLATARRYRPPEVARVIATSDETSVVRQRQSIPIDPHEPISPNPTPAYGLGYDDPMVWWGMGAMFAWQVVPMSVDLITTYNLFDTDNFQDVAVLRPIVENSTIPDLQALALQLATAVNAGLSSEVNSYTWRAPDVMLSTAQDWRKGQRSEQGHIMQATLDIDALVFHQHPAKPPPATEAEARSNTSYYWTGQGATPRSLQHERVNVSIYAPQYENSPGNPIPYLRYEDYTHAFFPTEHFDEVVEQDGWVIGRKGDGYVALWSWRPTEWRTYDPGTYTLGLTERFDLVAPGGPDNVWITEVGTAADWDGSPDPFAAFVDAITSTTPIVTLLPGPNGEPHSYGDGFDVQYDSPTAGLVEAGWNRPFVVAGVEQPLVDHPRMESPWTSVAFDTWRYRVEAGGVGIDHDLTQLAAYTGAEVPEPPTPPEPPVTPEPPGAGDPPDGDPAGGVGSTGAGGVAGGDASGRGASTSPRFTG